MDEAREILKDQFERLPEDVRTAITSVDLRNKLRSVAEKHRLHVDQAGALENETMLVMLGLEHPRDYIQNLEREAQVSASEARGIAEDINKEIFRQVRESLKKIHNIPEEIRGPEKASVKPQESVPTALTPLAEKKPERQEFFRTLKAKEPIAPAQEAVAGATQKVIYPLMPVTPKELVAKAPENLPVKEPEAAPPIAGMPALKTSVVPPKESPPAAKPETKAAFEAPMIFPSMPGKAAAPETPRPPLHAFPQKRAEGERTRGIVEEKLSAPFRMQNEERVHTAGTEPAAAPQNYGSTDPYREPVD